MSGMPTNLFSSDTRPPPSVFPPKAGNHYASKFTLQDEQVVVAGGQRLKV